MKNLIFIHGASSTPISFNFISRNLPEHNRIDFSYDCTVDVEEIVKDLFAAIPDEGEHHLIGHSLGGILLVGATYANQAAKSPYKKNILNSVTISSPMAGSKAASYLKWLYPKYGLFDNVSTDNPLILTIKRVGAIVPTLNIVTSGGELPLIKEKNDGVISVSSQMSLKKCDTRFFELNHFEVLLSDDVVKTIKEFIW